MCVRVIVCVHKYMNVLYHIDKYVVENVHTSAGEASVAAFGGEVVIVYIKHSKPEGSRA